MTDSPYGRISAIKIIIAKIGGSVHSVWTPRKMPLCLRVLRTVWSWRLLPEITVHRPLVHAQRLGERRTQRFLMHMPVRDMLHTVIRNTLGDLCHRVRARFRPNDHIWTTKGKVAAKRLSVQEDYRWVFACSCRAGRARKGFRLVLKSHLRAKPRINCRCGQWLNALKKSWRWRWMLF